MTPPLAIANPFAGVDHGVALWFHDHLTPTFVSVLRGITEFGSECVKMLVHRHRPFVDGWFVDWSGYSFASGHTIGATLLYGQLALFIIPAIKGRRGRVLTISAVSSVVALVGFSRIALGAHYITDVLGGIFFGMIWLTLCLLVARPLRRTALPPVIASVLPETDAVLVPVPVEADAPVAPVQTR